MGFDWDEKAWERLTIQTFAYTNHTPVARSPGSRWPPWQKFGTLLPRHLENYLNEIKLPDFCDEVRY